MDILPQSNDGGLPLRIVGLATEILFHALHDFNGLARLAAWLKKRQVVKTVALVINHYVPMNSLVRRQPFEHFFAAGDLREVGAHIDKRNAIVFGRQEANGIGSPSWAKTEVLIFAGSKEYLVAQSSRF